MRGSLRIEGSDPCPIRSPAPAGLVATLRGVATWRQRFLAPRVGFPSWSAQRPDLLFHVGDAGGTTQVWCHDLVDRPVDPAHRPAGGRRVVRGRRGRQRRGVVAGRHRRRARRVGGHRRRRPPHPPAARRRAGRLGAGTVAAGRRGRARLGRRDDVPRPRPHRGRRGAAHAPRVRAAGRDRPRVGERPVRRSVRRRPAAVRAPHRAGRHPAPRPARARRGDRRRSSPTWSTTGSPSPWATGHRCAGDQRLALRARAGRCRAPGGVVRGDRAARLPAGPARTGRRGRLVAGRPTRCSSCTRTAAGGPCTGSTSGSGAHELVHDPRGLGERGPGPAGRSGLAARGVGRACRAGAHGRRRGRAGSPGARAGSRAPAHQRARRGPRRPRARAAVHSRAPTTLVRRTRPC